MMKLNIKGPMPILAVFVQWGECFTWKQTMMYGVLSSHLAMMSCMLNWSGIFSLMSSTMVFTLMTISMRMRRRRMSSMVFTFSSRVDVAPPPLPDSLGCSSKTVLKSFSEVAVRKPISAFGWRPYR